MLCYARSSYVGESMQGKDVQACLQACQAFFLCVSENQWQSCIPWVSSIVLTLNCESCCLKKSPVWPCVPTAGASKQAFALPVLERSGVLLEKKSCSTPGAKGPKEKRNIILITGRVVFPVLWGWEWARAELGLVDPVTPWFFGWSSHIDVKLEGNWRVKFSVILLSS